MGLLPSSRTKWEESSSGDETPNREHLVGVAAGTGRHARTVRMASVYGDRNAQQRPSKCSISTEGVDDIGELSTKKTAGTEKLRSGGPRWTGRRDCTRCGGEGATESKGMWEREEPRDCWRCESRAPRRDFGAD